MAKTTGPVAQATGFLGFLARHWILSIVTVVIVVLFLSGPIKGLLAKVPFLSKFADGAEA